MRASRGFAGLGSTNRRGSTNRELLNGMAFHPYDRKAVA
jgi:hypothetical protein